MTIRRDNAETPAKARTKQAGTIHLVGSAKPFANCSPSGEVIANFYQRLDGLADSLRFDPAREEGDLQRQGIGGGFLCDCGRSGMGI